MPVDFDITRFHGSCILMSYTSLTGRRIRLFVTLLSLGNRTAGRRRRQIARVWQTWQGYFLRVLAWSSLTSMFSGLLQKDLFKGKWSLAKSYFKQNYGHACHRRFAVFFPLPSCFVSSLLKPRRRLDRRYSECRPHDFAFELAPVVADLYN